MEKFLANLAQPQEPARDPVLEDAGIKNLQDLLRAVENQDVDGTPLPEFWKTKQADGTIRKIFFAKRKMRTNAEGSVLRDFLWWSGMFWRRGAEVWREI